MNFQPPDGIVRGRVTDAATGAGLPLLSVWLYDSSANVAAILDTDAAGAYSSPGLAGRCLLRADVQLARLRRRALRQHPMPGLQRGDRHADPVTAGTTAGSINFALAVEGGRISGVVTESAGGAAIANVGVDMYNTERPICRLWLHQRVGPLRDVSKPAGRIVFSPWRTSRGTSTSCTSNIACPGWRQRAVRRFR